MLSFMCNNSVIFTMSFLSNCEPVNGLDDHLNMLLLVDSNPSSNSSASVISDTSSKAKKPRKTKEERSKLKEEKRKALEEKSKLREEKKREAETLKRLKPGECIKYINILLDSDIVNCKFSADLLMALQTSEIQYTVEKSKISNSMSWIRKLEDNREKSETQLLVVWAWKEFIDLIKNNNLYRTVQRYQSLYLGHQITIIIYGIEEYFRFLKGLKNRNLKSNVTEERVPERIKKIEDCFNTPFYNLADIEKNIIRLQLLFDLQYKFIETGPELGLFVVQFTKSLAELPFKLDRCKKEEYTEWFATADSKESVKVDNNGNGLSSLWQQQICQFPNVGLDIAQSIVSEYPSPQILIEAYDKCNDRREAELLLQDILIRRTYGPLTSSRRIGPELSKKIFQFFNNLDGNVALSQD